MDHGEGVSKWELVPVRRQRKLLMVNLPVSAQFERMEDHLRPLRWLLSGSLLWWFAARRRQLSVVSQLSWIFDVSRIP